MVLGGGPIDVIGVAVVEEIEACKPQPVAAGRQRQVTVHPCGPVVLGRQINADVAERPIRRMYAAATLDRLVAQGAVPAIVETLHLPEQEESFLELIDHVETVAGGLFAAFELGVEILSRRTVAKGGCCEVIIWKIAFLNSLPDMIEPGTALSAKRHDPGTRRDRARNRFSPELFELRRGDIDGQPLEAVPDAVVVENIGPGFLRNVSREHQAVAGIIASVTIASGALEEETERHSFRSPQWGEHPVFETDLEMSHPDGPRVDRDPTCGGPQGSGIGEQRDQVFAGRGDGDAGGGSDLLSRRDGKGRPESDGEPQDDGAGRSPHRGSHASCLATTKVRPLGADRITRPGVSLGPTPVRRDRDRRGGAATRREAGSPRSTSPRPPERSRPGGSSDPTPSRSGKARERLPG